ncbi:MAG: ribonuclease P protein component [Gammaproteobacteria bacterium]|nr:ribonuclease P protein component [Gammaproteobacteria bacterium]
MRRFSFPASSRIRSRVDFDRVFKRCVRSSDSLFTVLARHNELDHPRLGLVVSRKSAGNAVARNRIKRLVRESFRLSQHDLPAVDLVVLSRPGISQNNNAAIKASLNRHWQRIGKRCAR